MNAELLAALDHLTREKGIDREVILEALESALVSAARKALGPKVDDVTAKIDRTTGVIQIFSGSKEISEAGFGRIAAQTVKQVIFHKIREAERNAIFTEFSPRSGSLISGTMHRFERGAIIVDLGKTEAILPKREQSPKESFRPGDRVRAYCIEVNKTAKGPQVVLSRSHPSFVKELFKLEVPEISQGIVEVKSISREAGDRSKIAVYSKDEKVDCVGACVGMRGTRVKDIVRELHGEKIDIIRWCPKVDEFVTAALAPAKVAEIKVDDSKKRAEVIVEDDQLSLAIGKRGQNVRLAARLTGLDIDIRSRAQAAVLEKASLSDLEGVGPKLAAELTAAGYGTVAKIARSTVEELTQIKGVGEKTAEKLLEGSKQLLEKLGLELAAQELQTSAAEAGTPEGAEGIPPSEETSSSEEETPPAEKEDKE